MFLDDLFLFCWYGKHAYANRQQEITQVFEFFKFWPDAYTESRQNERYSYPMAKTELFKKQKAHIPSFFIFYMKSAAYIYLYA